jgi:sugar phosphate permease
VTHDTQGKPAAPLFRRPLRIRWWIFAFALAFSTLSYIQRLGVQDLAATIMPALHLSQMQIGWLATAFTAAYALAQFPGGILTQQLGARWTLVIVGVLGVVATVSFPAATMVLAGTALFVALLLAQVLLGVSQGPLNPAVVAIMESWLPEKRWAMANGLVSAVMNLGGTITPLLVVLLSGSFGWQGALLWIALPVALLTVAWGWYGRSRPGEHPAVTPEELAELGGGATEAARPVTLHRLRKLLSDRNVLLLTLSYLCMCFAFYLLSFWSFLYLVQVRHFSGIEAGMVGAVPWIGAGLGAAAGGFISDWLAGRIGVRWGYRLVPLLALPVAGIMLLVVTKVSMPSAAVLALAVAFFMVELTEGAYWASIMRVARADVAAASGILNTGGNAGGIITHPVVGFLTSGGAWGGAFITGTVFAVVAACLWLWIDPERRADVD